MDTGLEGVLTYVLAHIKGVMSQHSESPFDETYLGDLYRAVTTIPQETELSENFNLLRSKFLSFYEKGTDFDYTMSLLPIIEDMTVTKESLNDFPLGLKNGLSGFLLKKLLENRL